MSLLSIPLWKAAGHPPNRASSNVHVEGFKQMIMVGGAFLLISGPTLMASACFSRSVNVCIFNLSRLLHLGPGCLRREREGPHIGMAVITVFSWILHEPCTFWKAMLSVGETEAR